MQGNTLRANFPLRFVLLPLVDAHLPAPVSPPRAPGPRPRPRPYNPGSTRPCQTQPDPARFSLAPSAPPSPLDPGAPGVSPTVLRYLKIWARIQALIPQNAAHTTEPAVSTHTHRYSLPPSGSRQHSPAPAGVSKVVCCDIWIFGRVWDPICEISQHTSLENHRLRGAYG